MIGEDDDGFGKGEKPDSPCAVHQGGDGDERVGRVEVAAGQVARDEGAEPPATEPPSGQVVEVSPAPPRRGEPTTVIPPIKMAKTADWSPLMAAMITINFFGEGCRASAPRRQP